MDMDKNQAALALATIKDAGARSSRLQRYRRFAPYLILWGLIWLLADSASDLTPLGTGLIWLPMSLLGVAASMWLGARQSALNADPDHASPRIAHSWRWMLCMLVLAAFLVTTLIVLPPAGGRQQLTFISMFWTFLYMAVGVWAGWRLFAIGLIATVLIIGGYYEIHSHFALYMGWISGGALIAGGLWLRRL